MKELLSLLKQNARLSNAELAAMLGRDEATVAKQIAEMARGKKGILVAEINAGQMVEDVRLAINGALPVEYFGRLGGIVPEPEEIVNALKEKLL